MRALYEEEEKQSESFREALADRIDQTALVEHLKSKILQTVRARHAAQEKANREIAGIRKQMNEAGERLVAECDNIYRSLDKANYKKSKYKQIGLQLQEKLRRALKTIPKLQSDLSEAQDSLSTRSDECDQLRGIVSDRDVALDQMRTQLADLASERDRAMHDHTTLRDRMASLVTGNSSAASSKGESLAPASFPAAPRPVSDVSRSDRKRSRDSRSSSALPILKRVVRSDASIVKPSSVHDPKATRSASTNTPQKSPIRSPRETKLASKTKASPVFSLKPSSNPKGKRDLKGRRDPARHLANLKLGKQKRRGPSSTSS